MTFFFCALSQVLKFINKIHLGLFLGLFSLPMKIRKLHIWKLALKIIQNQTFLWTKLTLSPLSIGVQQYYKPMSTIHTAIPRLGVWHIYYFRVSIIDMPCLIFVTNFFPYLFFFSPLFFLGGGGGCYLSFFLKKIILTYFITFYFLIIDHMLI